MNKTEHISDEATEYYTSMKEYYESQGIPTVTAEELADQDLIEWSKPLELPDGPEENWYQ